MLIFYIFNIFYRVSAVTFGTFPVYKPFKNLGKSTQKVDLASSQQPAASATQKVDIASSQQPVPVAASSQQPAASSLPKNVDFQYFL